VLISKSAAADQLTWVAIEAADSYS
jgi:hypothetical protein